MEFDLKIINRISIFHDFHEHFIINRVRVSRSGRQSPTQTQYLGRVPLPPRALDHCTVSVAILDVGQSRQKLQQMYAEDSSTIDPYNSAITHRILAKIYSFKNVTDEVETISSKQEDEFKATTFGIDMSKLHTNPKVLN